MASKTVLSAMVVAAFAAGVGTDAFLNMRAASAAADFAFEKDIGGGEPNQVMIDNAKLRVTAVHFKKGTVRPGNLKRKSDQLIVYIDDGKLRQEPVPGMPAQDTFQDPLHCDTPIGCGPVDTQGQRARNVPSGSIAFRPKGSIAQTLDVQDDYRALYVELK